MKLQPSRKVHQLPGLHCILHRDCLISYKIPEHHQKAQFSLRFDCPQRLGNDYYDEGSKIMLYTAHCTIFCQLARESAGSSPDAQGSLQCILICLLPSKVIASALVAPALCVQQISELLSAAEWHAKQLHTGVNKESYGIV